MKLKRILAIVGILLIALLVTASIQATAKNRSNPPTIAEPQWDSPETRQLAVRACFDCHSNQTKWPLYSGLPIVGGLIEKHVVDGRKELNFSEWGTGQQESEEASEKVFEPMHYAEKDRFPQPPYSLLHPNARLTQTERQQLAQGLSATYGSGITNEVGEDEAQENDDD
jgi:cytochrome c553